MTIMNLEAIKDRLKYTKGFDPSLQVLTELQRNFLLTVPFENLDIHLNIPMDLSVSALFKKIVARQRGGLCFENNILFYSLLQLIGFDVQFVGAEMYQGQPNSIGINHMALLVSIKNESYLVDVGNGKFYGIPIPIKNRIQIRGEDAIYWVDDYHEFKVLYYLDQNGQKQPRYAFDTAAKQFKDFIQPSIYTQTSPESIFKQKILVTKYLENGRMTLSDNKLIHTRAGKQETKELESPEEYRDILTTFFGIKLEEAQLLALTKKVQAKN